jgi:hypothetical protein
MEVTVTFPPGSKPHEAASKDAGRPHLGGVWIVPRKKKDGGGHVAISSNSYILAEVPVDVTGDLPTDEKHPLWIPSSVVKEVTKPRRVENAVHVTDTTFEPVKQPSKKRGPERKMFYERQPEIDNPRIIGHGALWPEHGPKRLRVGINAELLFELAQALGGFMRGVQIEFDLADDSNPLFGRPVGPTDNAARGIIMPVRLNV